MKKIVHLTMSGEYGGAESVIFNIILRESSKKYDIKYIAPKGGIIELLRRQKINYYKYNLGGINKLIRNLNPDILHAHDYKASIIASLFGRNRIISHLHTNHRYFKRFGIRTIIYLIASLRFEKIIIVSKTMANDMWFYKFIKNKSEILVNPLDSEKIKIMAVEYTVDETYDLVFLGRLSKYKNPIDFIEVVRDIKKSKSDIKAIIIGDGEQRVICENLIRQYNLEDNITIKGFLENPFPYIKQSKILLVPSKVEALGLCAGEAMILDKVVIANNIGGLKDFINENNGILVNSKEDMVKWALVLLNDKNLYDRLSKNRGDILNFFDMSSYIKEIEGIYDDEIR